MATSDPWASRSGGRSGPAIRRRIVRQSLSVALAVAPFGFVFGVTAAQAGLSAADAAGFSLLVFAGSSQFAAVGVLGDGGTAFAAITAGLLLNIRIVAFGVLLAPELEGPWWKRAAWAQLIVDESAAVGLAQEDRRLIRFGFLWAGVSLFTFWNIATQLGVAVGSAGDADFITEWGLDAAGPAVFLALLWPRLETDAARRIALAGAVLATIAVPLVPAGLPILIGGFGVLAAREAWR